MKIQLGTSGGQESGSISLCFHFLLTSYPLHEALIKNEKQKKKEGSSVFPGKFKYPKLATTTVIIHIKYI